MKTLGPGHAAAIQNKIVTAPRTLIKATFDPSGTPDIYYWSGGEQVVWDGDTYTPLNISDISISNVSGRVTGCSFSVSTDELAVIALFRGPFGMDGIIEVFETDQDAGSGADEAERRYYGVIETQDDQPGLIKINSNPEPAMYPFTDVSERWGYETLSPPGTYSTPIGTITISRDDGR